VAGTTDSNPVRGDRVPNADRDDGVTCRNDYDAHYVDSGIDGNNDLHRTFVVLWGSCFHAFTVFREPWAFAGDGRASDARNHDFFPDAVGRGTIAYPRDDYHSGADNNSGTDDDPRVNNNVWAYNDAWGNSPGGYIVVCADDNPRGNDSPGAINNTGDDNDAGAIDDARDNNSSGADDNLRGNDSPGTIDDARGNNSSGADDNTGDDTRVDNNAGTDANVNRTCSDLDPGTDRGIYVYSNTVSGTDLDNSRPDFNDSRAGLNDARAGFNDARAGLNDARAGLNDSNPDFVVRTPNPEYRVFVSIIAWVWRWGWLGISFRWIRWRWCVVVVSIVVVILGQRELVGCCIDKRVKRTGRCIGVTFIGCGHLFEWEWQRWWREHNGSWDQFVFLVFIGRYYRERDGTDKHSHGELHSCWFVITGTDHGPWQLCESAVRWW
jgi:hypothetical protein